MCPFLQKFVPSLKQVSLLSNSGTDRLNMAKSALILHVPFLIA